MTRGMATSALGALWVAVSPVAARAQEEDHSVAWDTLFSVEPGLMVWTVLTFLVLLWVLGRFAWKPLLGALDAREQRIRDNIEEAQRLKEESEALSAEHRAQLAEARREAQRIIAESRDAADRVRRDIEEKARTESQAILDRARAEIERGKVAALEQIRRESVEIALGAAGKLIGQSLDGETDRALVERYLTGLEGRSGAEA